MYRVLIVDDSRMMRNIVERGVRASGVEIQETVHASDGAEALAAIENGTFDLLLSDVNMPNMNGLELVQRLRRNGQAQPPTIMVTTEGVDNPAVQAALGHPAVFHLRKPFSNEALGQMVREVLTGAPVSA